MRAVVISMWALFTGLALLMLGNGLLATLLGVRASLSGFATGATGMVMACYYVGYLFGAWLTPKLIGKVGHIRVFTAMAALVSFAPLAHSLLVQPLFWAMLRVLAGIGMVGIYIICESWLNSEATSENRGRILAVYILVCQCSQGAAQLLLGYGDPMGFKLFVLIASLCTLAVIPTALANQQAPRFEDTVSIPLGLLRRRAGVALLGLLLISTTYGAFYAMAAVYALKTGLETSQIGSFMAFTILGSICLQWPVGMLSDRMDRRRLIVMLCIAVLLVMLLLALLPDQTVVPRYALMFVYGGLSFPLYGVFVALIGDALQREEMVAASSRILLVNGIGSALGPLLVAGLMGLAGAPAYPLFLALLHATVAALLARDIGRAAQPAVVDQPVHYAPIMPQVSQVATGMAGEVAAES